MYLHFHNVVLYVIFLTSSTAHTQSEKECIGLIINNTESAANQNQTKCLAKELKDSSAKTELKSNKNVQKDTSIRVSRTSFLPKDTIVSALNIPVSNNGNSIDILKEATGTNKSTNADTTEYKEKNEFQYSYNANLTTSIDTAKSSITANSQVKEKNITTPELLPKATTAFSTFNTKNEEAIGILKGATDSMADNKNVTKHDQNYGIKMEEDSVMKYDGNFTTSNNTTQASNKDFEVSTETNNSSTDAQMPADEIALSELVNLSYNDGEELNVGQKIEFQRSNLNSETEVNNTAGLEILKEISGICGTYLGRRISFANETTLMEFPWTALLLYNTKIRYHCGGSLITRKYILTAAHCVAQEFYELIGVRLGEYDITTEVDCAPDLAGDKICAKTIHVDIVKIIVHHAYSHLSFKNDIALLRLDKDYIGRSYYPICLPKPDMRGDEKTAIVAGWGATEKALRSAILLKANVPVFDMSKCREIYRYSVFNDSKEICGSGENEVDVCKGDSGGALFNSRNVRGRDKYFQYGIISLGVRRCGDNRFLPAVFTKTSGFYKWIENNLEY